ncbi:DUF559 domain-containing protein [Candidatus Woesearchaeota archaeon]|nr:MAG: DUF559 domain-containing protein [Candidatus Woesearchaeota archaeon]
MAKCVKCGGYAKRKGWKCSACYTAENKPAEPVQVMTKKEAKARNKATSRAIKLNDALRKKGIGTMLECPDGHKRVDIRIWKYKLDLEVDGVQHNTSDVQALKDLQRTCGSLEKGFVTVRVPNVLVDKQLDKCIDIILKIIETRQKERKT